MAPPKPQPELDITSPKAQAELAKDAPKPAKPEVVDVREKALDAQKSLAKIAIGYKNTELKMLGSEFTPEMQTYLEQYFQGAINTYDKDRDGKIDGEESKKFSEDMEIKIGKIIGEHTPDSATKNAKEKAEKAGAAVEKPEVTAKNVADIKINANTVLIGNIGIILVYIAADRQRYDGLNNNIGIKTFRAARQRQGRHDLRFWHKTHCLGLAVKTRSRRCDCTILNRKNIYPQKRRTT